MCLKTHDSFITDQESFLKHHKLFSMLICEIYDLLTLYQPSSLTSEEIFKDLTPFLKSRIRFILHNEPDAKNFFYDEYTIIQYVVDLLASKIPKIHSTPNGLYYIESSEQKKDGKSF